MFKKIIGTAGSKIIIAALSLIIVFIVAKYLGAEGLGTVGLIVLAVTIILMFNNFIGGSVLVYLVPRESNFKLLFISYLWSILVVFIFWCLFHFIHLKVVHFAPQGYENQVLALSFISSVFNLHLFILLGKEKIREYNYITTLQSIVQTVVLVFFFIILKQRTLESFIISLFSAYGFSFLSSSILLFPLVKKTDIGGLIPIASSIIKLGFFNQLAVIVQTLNYRLNYFLIDTYLGRAGLGMFHFGNQLAEGTWVVSRSIAIVQYSKISNSSDLDYVRRLSIRLFKLTFIMTVLILAFFLILPEKVYLLFGKDFNNTHLIILSLALGIFANSVAMIFGHYFVGRGKMHVNLIGSSIGLIFTIVIGLILIPRMGIYGAGITASVSYLSSMVFLLIRFIRVAKPKAAEFLITREDYSLFRKEIIKVIKKESVTKESLAGELP